ncbi:MAG: tRNA 2-thiouridine(34) synthase MnmA [Planctomycetota bacterium]|nr:tRNA 2-thiouridine(34) synthase MnmA [Planctomycetota bacterium]
MKPGHGKKVLVAMSGGVDSSVAAALLKEDGYEVVGCFMRLGGSGADEPGGESDGLAFGAESCDPAKIKIGHQGCCSVNDAADARFVAARLDIPFYVLNFRKDFGRIVDYFVSEYNAGRTPNPCVRCNDWLKFGKLADYARSIDAEFVATGHYARVSRNPVDDRPRLMRGRDPKKDQSYVLFGTKREMLGHMLLPIGDMLKPDVRALAESMNLPVFNKPDSQEICFVPDNNYAGLVQRRTPERVAPGDIVDGEGRVLGRHEGQQHFTIGQRRGTGVARGVPLYVLQRDPAANTVTLGPREGLLAGGLEADQVNWLVDPPESGPRRCAIKIRYNGQPVPGTVHATGPDALEVRFDEPQSAVTPGQAVVCYDGEELIGGGWITRAVG